MTSWIPLLLSYTWGVLKYKAKARQKHMPASQPSNLNLTTQTSKFEAGNIFGFPSLPLHTLRGTAGLFVLNALALLHIQALPKAWSCCTMPLEKPRCLACPTDPQVVEFSAEETAAALSYSNSLLPKVVVVFLCCWLV